MPPRSLFNGGGSVVASEVASEAVDGSSGVSQNKGIRAQAFLVENGGCVDRALLSACWSGDAALGANLIAEFGAKVSANSNTPIHIAVRRNHCSVIRMLVKDFGADVCAKDDDGWAPLHIAAQCGNHEVIRVLAGEFGVDVSTKSEEEGFAPPSQSRTVQLHRGSARVGGGVWR